MRPMWQEIEAEMPELKTEYYDADENPELIKKYGIKNLPAFIFLDSSENEILRLKGVQNKKDFFGKSREEYPCSLHVARCTQKDLSLLFFC